MTKEGTVVSLTPVSPSTEPSVSSLGQSVPEQGTVQGPKQTNLKRHPDFREQRTTHSDIPGQAGTHQDRQGEELG